MKSVVLCFLFIILVTIGYGQSAGNVPLTPQHERWKDIIREDGEEAFYKECSAATGGEVLFLCDTMKDILKEVIANETKTGNASTESDLDNPEGYEIYTDEIAGFSLEHPVDWKIDSSSSPSLTIFYKGSIGFEVKLWDNIIFSFLDVKDHGEVAQDTATDDENEKLEESLKSYDKGIDGEEAVTFTYSDSGVLKKVVSVLHDGKAYDFTYSSSKSTLEDDEETMNHFFDSVKLE